MRNLDEVINDGKARMLYFSGVNLIRKAFELTDAESTKLTTIIAAELLQWEIEEKE